MTTQIPAQIRTGATAQKAVRAAYARPERQSHVRHWINVTALDLATRPPAHAQIRQLPTALFATMETHVHKTISAAAVFAEAQKTATTQIHAQKTHAIMT